MVTTTAALMIPALAGCGTAPAPEPEKGVTDVLMRNVDFSPAVVTIKQGETVRWTNTDIVPHTATSGNPGDADEGADFDSPFLGSGQSYRRQFDQAGEYIYYCRVHPNMMRDAKVIVEAP
jgi:plastocyanin